MEWNAFFKQQKIQHIDTVFRIDDWVFVYRLVLSIYRLEQECRSAARWLLYSVSFKNRGEREARKRVESRSLHGSQKGTEQRAR